MNIDYDPDNIGDEVQIKSLNLHIDKEPDNEAQVTEDYALLYAVIGWRVMSVTHILVGLN